MKARILEAGRIISYDSHDQISYELKNVLLIQFDNANDLRAALTEGRIELELRFGDEDE